MTGKQWSDYFQSLTPEKRGKLLNALQTLANDPMFCEAYGNDFKDLASFIGYPLASS